MAAVEFCRDVDGEPAVAKGLRRVFRVGGSGKKIAAHGEENEGFPLVHGADGVYDVVAGFAWRLEFEYLFERIEEFFCGLLPDAYRSVALDIAMAADGAGAGAGFSDAAF